MAPNKNVSQKVIVVRRSPATGALTPRNVKGGITPSNYAKANKSAKMKKSPNVEKESTDSFKEDIDFDQIDVLFERELIELR